MKFIMLINVKMPKIVGILTFISMINTISESLGPKKIVQNKTFLRNAFSVSVPRRADPDKILHSMVSQLRL